MDGRARLSVLPLVLLILAAAACARPAPLSIDELRARDFSTSLSFVRQLGDGQGFSAYLVSYESAGLSVHAMVAVPEGDRPPRGFPVLIANHGHHPDPPRYGITADGVDARPGDYYRDVPALYTAHGFLVVMPDYRGHSDSEGVDFTEGLLEASYYVEDVLALLSAIDDIDGADPDNVFMWGHSMGGDVTLRALLATDRVRAASLWSTVGGNIWQQAYFYSRIGDPLAADSDSVGKPAIDALKAQLEPFGTTYDWQAREPMLHLDHLETPLILHHAVRDASADYGWSRDLARELALSDRRYEFHSYDSSEHLFTGEDRDRAVARDVAFFRSVIAAKRP